MSPWKKAAPLLAVEICLYFVVVGLLYARQYWRKA